MHYAALQTILFFCNTENPEKFTHKITKIITKNDMRCGILLYTHSDTDVHCQNLLYVMIKGVRESIMTSNARTEGTS